MTERPTPLIAELLTPAAFAPFGDVIAPEAAASEFAINTGTAQRFHDLARIDTGSAGGRTCIDIVRAVPRALPFTVAMLERHPLGSQAFVPLDGARWIVVVASDPEATPRAFLADRGQGVNYRRGTWHHPLIVLDREAAFLVIDRGGDARPNCDEVTLARQWTIALT